MNILRALHLGMCFGVRDAIAIAHRESRQAPLTILGDLVHNPTVLDDLRRRGVRIERDLDQVTTPSVLITAHGASLKRRTEVAQRGHRVVEATCPLVHLAHERVAALVREGFHPVIVGQREHVEVRGLTEDLIEFDVILSEADIEAMTPRPRFGVAAQTTQPPARVQHLLRALRRRFPASEVRFTDTVCQPTKQRQAAAEELAAMSDVVIVIGGPHSNNTRELAATCARFCERVQHVQTANDLVGDWFRPDDTVGITAGTSTPDGVIDDVERRLQQIAEAWEPHPVGPRSTSQPALVLA